MMGYGVVASLTAAFLLFVFGPKLARAVLREVPHLGLADWLMMPLVGLFVLFGAGFGLWAASFLWPVTAFFLVRHWLEKKDRKLQERDKEYESIMGEIRQFKEEMPGASRNG